MRVHSVSKIKSLKKQRKAGYSIQELMKKFGMPKTTIWHYIHNIKLSEKNRRKIKEKQGGSKIRMVKQLEKASCLANQIVEFIDINRVAPIVLSLLYWAEGNKKGFVFTNTDSDMIKVFLKIIRYNFGVKENRIKATIRINNFQNHSECLNYWHKITSIPIKNMRVDLNPIQNKGKSVYGVFRITIKKGGYLLKLVNSFNKELTLRVLSSILKTTSPLVAQMD